MSARGLLNDTGKTEVLITTSQLTRAVNFKNKTFDTCDFNHFDLKDSSFSGCLFVNCRFIKAILKE